MRTKKLCFFEVTAFTLHILAMVFMLCDHLWATVISGNADVCPPFGDSVQPDAEWQLVLSPAPERAVELSNQLRAVVAQ